MGDWEFYFYEKLGVGELGRVRKNFIILIFNKYSWENFRDWEFYLWDKMGDGEIGRVRKKFYLIFNKYSNYFNLVYKYK